jgi:NAD(P) transhydrogenase subunit alpha
MVDKATKSFAINREDELVKATMLTDGGKVVHPAFANAAAAAAEAPKPIVPRTIVPGQNRGDDPATDAAGADAEAKKPAAKKSRKPATGGEA